MKSNLTLTTKLALVVAFLSAAAFAQTYTYVIEREGNLEVGRPISALTITGDKAYGSATAPYNQLYEAQPSGVRKLNRCCASEAPLALDASSNLYGQDTTTAHFYGRIFMIGPSTDWKETDLHDFTGGDDGWVPPSGSLAEVNTESAVSLDSSGSVLGMTYYGGPNSCPERKGTDDGCGVLFALTNNNGTWTETVIHAFSGPPDGALPEGGLTYDAATGNYYGMTEAGGDPVCNCGTVFQLTPNGDGTWSESVVYSFTDGKTPVGGVILDGQGNLYGANIGAGGVGGDGYIYEISAGQLSVLYNFAGEPDGQYPTGALIFDPSGNLLGTTYSGGTYDLGTVFELTPSEGSWQETIIHSFADKNQKPTDGYYPNTGLAMDSSGNFWGTLLSGGSSGNGLFYELRKQESKKGAGYHNSVGH
jgi:hypothetical protein